MTNLQGESLRKGAMVRVPLLMYLLVALLCSFSAEAGEADVLQVEVKLMSHQLYRFDVTVMHADEGWEHFADRWDVVAPDGTVLATRILTHPHENEQPFTRSLFGVKVPEEITEVTVRAHDMVHGYSGKTVTVTLPH